AGLLLDRLNRKRLIAIGMLLTAAALYLYDFASTPGQLLALRAFHGLVAGVLAPGAFAMLGDRTTLHRTRSIGMSGALIAVSAVIGPPLAGYIRDLWGFGAVFATSGTLMLLAAMVFLIKVPSMPIEAVQDRAVASTRTSTPTWRRLTPVFCAVLAMTFGIGSLINHLPIALELAGAAPRISGIAFATFSLVAAVVMASPVHRAIDGVSRRLAVSLGFALLGGSGLILGVSNGVAAPAFGAMVVFGFGFGLLFPSLGATVSDVTSSRRTGTAFGIFYAVYSLGVVLGSTVSGMVAEVAASLGAPFFVSAAVALIALPTAVYIRAVRRGTSLRSAHHDSES
ncbi:MAG: MFS transporter, partial [Chloroflexi bacterium]|nr:MFS transporter [Chloroflexota bacterium]